MSTMKIFIKENKESARYISEIKAALQKAGHQVFQDSDFPEANEGLKSCHVRMDLSPAGMANDKESINRPFVRTEVDLRVRKMVQVIARSSLPRRQIVADLGLRQQSRRNFIYNYLKPAVAQGYVTMSFPGAPNKPEQTYRLTAKGLELYESLMNSGSK